MLTRWQAELAGRACLLRRREHRRRTHARPVCPCSLNSMRQEPPARSTQRLPLQRRRFAAFGYFGFRGYLDEPDSPDGGTPALAAGWHGPSKRPEARCARRRRLSEVLTGKGWLPPIRAPAAAATGSAARPTVAWPPAFGDGAAARAKGAGHRPGPRRAHAWLAPVGRHAGDHRPGRCNNDGPCVATRQEPFPDS